MHSDQLTLAKGIYDGWNRSRLPRVVIELDDRATPVNLADVVASVLAARVRVLLPQ